MNSIENIINRIKQKTEKEIEKIKEDCYLELEKIKEKTKKKIEESSRKIEEKIENKKKEIRMSFEVDLNQFKNKKILSKKEEILKKTIALAFIKFYEDERYLNFIVKLLLKNLPDENVEIFIGEKDYEKVKEELLKNKNLQLNKTNNYKHGFSIVNEKYILNFNLEEIFLENMEQIKKTALDALDLKDVVI